MALLGLTFKPDTDDMRDAPSLSIISGLQDGGAKVVAYDPEGIEQAKPMLQGVSYAEDAYACATGADVLVLVTEWRQFRALDLPRLKELMNAPVLVDLRNVYSPAEAEKHGFQYTGIGVV
ncbi:hypothetical protein ASG52_24100 [Methylobacterium sp. Leaf456]|nr:hypothetical protein ASG52_24100 [Methylobacterium sp. Leaf456]